MNCEQEALSVVPPFPAADRFRSECNDLFLDSRSNPILRLNIKQLVLHKKLPALRALLLESSFDFVLLHLPSLLAPPSGHLKRWAFARRRPTWLIIFLLSRPRSARLHNPLIVSPPHRQLGRCPLHDRGVGPPPVELGSFHNSLPAPTSAPPGLLWPALQPAFSPSSRLAAEIELSKDPYRTFLWLGWAGLRLEWRTACLTKVLGKPSEVTY